MAEEPDLLSQLRSLGDPDEPRDLRAELDALDDQAPVGVSETARQLEGEGYFGALSDEHERNRRIGEATAFLNSRKERLRAEHEAQFGPQEPPISGEKDSFGGELFREVGRGFAGSLPKRAGGFLRQVGSSIADPQGDSNDPSVALARGMTEAGQAASDLGERNIRSIPARRVQDMTKISRDSIGSFVRDTSDWLTSQVGQAVGTGLPMIAAGMTMGPAGLAMTAFPMGIGEVRESLEEEGIDDPKLINQYGWLAGMAVGALDAIVPAHILSDEFKRGAGKYILTRMVKTAAKIGAEEALTEAMQEAVQIAAVAEARGMHVGQDRHAENVYNIGRELFEKRWQIAEAGAGGFIGGTTLGSARIVQSGRAPGAPDEEQAAQHAEAARGPIDLDQYAEPSTPREGGEATPEATGLELAAPPRTEAPVVEPDEDGNETSSGERLGLRGRFGNYLRAETDALELGGAAPPEIQEAVERMEQDILEEFRAEGLPGDNLESGALPVDSIADVRLAFASASKRELELYWSRPSRVSSAPQADLAASVAPIRPEETSIVAPEPVSNDAGATISKTRFREIVAGNSPRTRWVQELGSTPEGAQALVDEAIAEGLLRVDGRGRIMRTASTRTTFVNLEIPQAGPASEAIETLRLARFRSLPASSFIEENTRAPEEIVNPISIGATPEKQLAEIKALTEQNVPLIEGVMQAIDAELGTESKLSRKLPERIVEKGSRPVILKAKPWHKIEHVRDTLRFKTPISHIDQVPEITEKFWARSSAEMGVDRLPSVQFPELSRKMEKKASPSSSTTSARPLSSSSQTIVNIIGSPLRNNIARNGLNRNALGLPNLRPEIVASWPQTAPQLIDELYRMLPPDVAIRVVDNLIIDGIASFGVYDHPTRTLKLDSSMSIRQAYAIGAHEIHHALRFLFTDPEWKLLVGHANEIRIDREMVVQGPRGRPVPSIPLYRKHYGQQLRKMGYRGAQLEEILADLIDQERVSKMAETYIQAKLVYPNRISQLLDRILKFFEALGNWWEGQGFQTIEDIFADVKSGKVGARRRPSVEYAPPAAQPPLAAFKGMPNPIKLGQGPQGITKPNLEKPQKGLSDLVDEVNEALGLTTRMGRLNPGLKAAAGRMGKRVAGQFGRTSGIVRIATPNDIATLSHEGGHALEARADIKADLNTLKQVHVEELTTPPAMDIPPGRLAPSGYSGVELDADTQRLLVEATITDRAWRQMTAVVGAAKSGRRGAIYSPLAYTAAQEAAAKAWGRLVRRVGHKRAVAYIDDVRKHLAPTAAPTAYVQQRFSGTGVPRPRPARTATAEQLSEGFAEFFRLYMTKPAEARKTAPAFSLEFEDLLDGTDPGLLEKLDGVQRGFQALINASPAGAVRSRVQSTVVAGPIARTREEIADKGVRATVSDKLYTFYTAFVDARHPLKRAVKYLLETAGENLGLQLGAKERLVLKAIDDPYKLARLSEHAKVWATNTLQNGVRFKGAVDPTGPSFHDALTQAYAGTRKGQWNEQKAELFGSYLTTRRMLAEFPRYDAGHLENLPDQLIDRKVWAKARRDLEKA